MADRASGAGGTFNAKAAIDALIQTPAPALDANHDGSPFDDIMGMAQRFMKK